MSTTSIWKTVGIGRVGSNKEMGEGGKPVKEVDIIPMEWLSMADGEMNSNPTPLLLKATDSAGVEKQGVVTTDLKITATWLPSGTNRLTPPDVRRGERVEILQAGDADKFYWKIMGLDDNLRKLETIVFGISATTDEKDTELSLKNMYWFELSSHTKKFSFSSCKANGEPFLYTMYFDMAVGEFAILDDIGNYIHMVSKLNLIHMQNADGTYVKLDKKDVKVFAPQDMIIDVARNIMATAGKNFMVKAGTMAQIDGGGSVQTWTGGSTTLKTPQFIGMT